MALTTRLHGLIDYAAAITLGSFALFGGLSRPARRVAAVATIVPVSYFLVTDYEAGLASRVTMREHLTLDLAEGLLLFGAGVVMRNQPAASRVILSAYGLAQFLLAVNTTETPRSRPGQGSGPLARLLGPA